MADNDGQERTEDPTSKKIESAADLWAFFAHHLKL